MTKSKKVQTRWIREDGIIHKLVVSIFVSHFDPDTLTIGGDFSREPFTTLKSSE